MLHGNDEPQEKIVPTHQQLKKLQHDSIEHTIKFLEDEYERKTGKNVVKKSYVKKIEGNIVHIQLSPELKKYINWFTNDTQSDRSPHDIIMNNIVYNWKSKGVECSSKTTGSTKSRVSKNSTKRKFKKKSTKRKSPKK
jgi:hypothetical protein